MAAGEDSLEVLLEKATIPVGQQTDWTAINAFSQKVQEKQKPEEIQQTIWLLVRHIQSSIEIEAINALKALELCVERCGGCFRDEVGKFRFLNELIKLVSPKYLGNRTSPAVKKKVVELLYKWSCSIKDQPKFEQAYGMLKRQGVVTQDPILKPPETPPPPRAKNEIFDDEEKAKALHKLLHSSNRDDYQAANRLIKTMVKEHERRVEQVVRRETDLETVSNNVKVLGEMLTNYRAGSTSVEEVEVIKELYQMCNTLRPTLFRLASETDDKDNYLGCILKSNDALTEVIEQYQKLFGSTNGQRDSQDLKRGSNGGNVSLLDLGSPEDVSKLGKNPCKSLDDQLLSLGFDDELLRPPSIDETTGTFKSDMDVLSDIFSSVTATGGQSAANVDVTTKAANTSFILTPMTTASNSADLDGSLPSTPPKGTLTSTEKRKPAKGFEDLDALGLSLLKQSLPPNMTLGTEFTKPVEKLSMNQMKKHGQPTLVASMVPSTSPVLQPRARLVLDSLDSIENSPTHGPNLLTDLFVPLELIKPGTTPPLTLYDKNDLTVVIHFAMDSPKPDVFVMAVTAINRSSKPISDFKFEATVPENLKVKLQRPSNTHLPAFNPILPPSAITQVMLIAKSPKDTAKLKSYKICYVQDDQTVTVVGEMECLPLA